jgi:hypothetical protein
MGNKRFVLSRINRIEDDPNDENGDDAIQSEKTGKPLSIFGAIPIQFADILYCRLQTSGEYNGPP